MKKLLLLGNNLGYQEVEQYVRERGDYLIITDNIPVFQSAAKQSADEAWNISTMDIDKLYDKCILEKVDGVLATTGEMNLRSAIMLAEKLGRPFYVSLDTWNSMNDKRCFKEICRKYDLPVSPDYAVEDLQSEDEFPVIVKPASNSLNRGISICFQKEELSAACDKAEKNSKNGKIFIEKYIKGTQLSFFYHMVDGQIECTDIVEFWRSSENSLVCAVVGISTSEQTERYMKLYGQKVEIMLRETGCLNGMALIQGIVEEKTGKLYFIENNFRLDGVGCFDLHRLYFGIDAVKIITDIALDGRTDFKPVPYFCRPDKILAHYGIWASEKCRITKITGLGEIKEHIKDAKIMVKYHEGEYFDSNDGNGDMILGFGFSGNNREDIIKNIQLINSKVQIYNEKGNDILIRYEDMEMLRNRKILLKN